MDKLKDKFTKIGQNIKFIKAKSRQKINNIKKKRLTITSDLLIFASLFIIFITTYKLIWWLGMYLLALILLLLSYIISKIK